MLVKLWWFYYQTRRKCRVFEKNLIDYYLLKNMPVSLVNHGANIIKNCKFNWCDVEHSNIFDVVTQTAHTLHSLLHSNRGNKLLLLFFNVWLMREIYCCVCVFYEFNLFNRRHYRKQIINSFYDCFINVDSRVRVNVSPVKN